jgi:lipopolysaccharide transport system permease protein
MAVVMRVDVSGIAAHELAEPLELQGDISGDNASECALRPHERPRPSSHAPTSNLDVEPNSERGVLSGVFGSLGRSPPVHHQAGARHNPALVRLDDPSIDAAAEPEVVGVDDEQSQAARIVIYSGLVQVDQEARSRGGAMTIFGGEAAVRGLVRSVAGSADVLRALTESDIRFRYGRGPFRFARWLLEPVALVGVYLILVTFVLNRPGRAPGLSLACAVIPFQLVMLTIANAMTTLDARRPILLNMAFRRMLLPISAALTESVAFASSLLLLIAMMAIYGVAPTWNVLWFPLVLLVNLLLAIAAAYAAILFGIWLRELRAFVISFVRILFFLAPGLVPLADTREDVRDLLRLNPLTGLFEAYRDVFMNGTRPALWELVFPLIAAVILLAIFVPIYRTEQRQFVKVI